MQLATMISYAVDVDDPQVGTHTSSDVDIAAGEKLISKIMV